MDFDPNTIFRLDGRVAMVTGASRGIGRAVAKGFAAAGAKLVLTSRNQADCDKVASEIEARGGEALAVAAELQDLSYHEPLIRSAVERFGGLDILVNNAAALKPHFIEKLSEEEFDSLYALNVKGAVFLTKAALPHLAAKGGGVVINLGAVAGHEPMKGIGAYGSTKAAMLNWTRVMAQEFAPRGVRVNALTPGSVATDMILPSDPERRSKFMADRAGDNLVGRVAEPEELVGPALFLASDASAFMTGQALVVDGGLMA